MVHASPPFTYLTLEICGGTSQVYPLDDSNEFDDLDLSVANIFVSARHVHITHEMDKITQIRGGF